MCNHSSETVCVGDWRKANLFKGVKVHLGIIPPWDDIVHHDEIIQIYLQKSGAECVRLGTFIMSFNAIFWRM